MTLWSTKGAGLRSATMMIFVSGALLTTRAAAVPSFSRQTGLACNVCHLTPPELTEFGRLFKLNGYTMTGMKQIQVKSAPRTAGLSINEALPISVMLQVADTAMRKPLAGTQNNTTEFPQQLGLFLAGALAPHIGSFTQLTYTSANDHFVLDNTDFRFARSGTLTGKSLIYGATLNNNPSVEDVWNDTPAWGFPWASPDAAVSANAASILSGALASDVMGLGAYGFWDNHLYGDVTLYRSAHLGAPLPNAGTGYNFNVARAAPYWRVAWQQTLGGASLEVGSFGMHMHSFPNAISGPTDAYTDLAADFQLQAPLGKNTITVHGIYINEDSDLAGAVAAGLASTESHFLHNGRLDATVHFGDRYTAGAGWFGNSGNSDPLLYPSNSSATGSANGSPANNGWILQAGYWPEQNVELMAQYTGYQKFNGARLNYDGTGRNASDNNTVYLMAWFIF